MRLSSLKTLRARYQIHYHPFLFLFMSLLAMTELGLSIVSLENGGDPSRQSRSRYHSLLSFFCFNAAWTVLFSTAYVLWVLGGAGHILASVGSSVIWLLVTSILWFVASAYMHGTRLSDDCTAQSSLSNCRQSLAIEAIGWGELGISLLTLAATCIWIRRKSKFKLVDSRRLV